MRHVPFGVVVFEYQSGFVIVYSEFDNKSIVYDSNNFVWSDDVLNSILI